MLGLRQEVGSNHCCISGFVSDDKDFARPSQLVDADLTKYLAICLVNKALPGPTILSTAGIVSVPYAMAAIAWAPPTRKMRPAPAR